MELTEVDRLNAGKPQLLLEGCGLRATVVPERGGRIASLEYEGSEALHCLYPKGFEFGPYTEYGGIEEHVGSAPGTVWNVPWTVERGEQSVTLSAYSNQTLVRKKIRIDDALPLLRIEYELAHYGSSFARFTFGIHPELRPGGDHRSAHYHVPGADGIEAGGYTQPGFRQYITPSAGWSAATVDGRVFAQMLPPGVIDSLEVYYPKVDTHLVLQPVVFGVGLSPEMTVRFPYYVYYGPGGVEQAVELYQRLLPDLAPRYQPADPRPDVPAPGGQKGAPDGHFRLEHDFERIQREFERAGRGRGRRGPDAPDGGFNFDFGRVHVDMGHNHEAGIEVERLEREAEERASRDRERAERQAERDRHRAERDAERDRRHAERQAGRDREQFERDRANRERDLDRIRREAEERVRQMEERLRGPFRRGAEPWIEPVPPTEPYPVVEPVPPVPAVPPVPVVAAVPPPGAVEPPRPAAPPDWTDLKQERMLILQGLAEGRYAVEDALRLLDRLAEMTR